MRVHWNDHEREYVRANAGIMTDAELGANLTRITGRYISIFAAREQRQAMGLKKKAGRGVCKLQDDVPTLAHIPDPQGKRRRRGRRPR